MRTINQNPERTDPTHPEPGHGGAHDPHKNDPTRISPSNDPSKADPTRINTPDQPQPTHPPTPPSTPTPGSVNLIF